MLRISNHHNQSLFHSLVARKIPKQQQQPDQNNNIHSSNPNAKTHKKKKKYKVSEQTQHKTENPEFTIIFLDFLGNQTGPKHHKS